MKVCMTSRRSYSNWAQSRTEHQPEHELDPEDFFTTISTQCRYLRFIHEYRLICLLLTKFHLLIGLNRRMSDYNSVVTNRKRPFSPRNSNQFSRILSNFLAFLDLPNPQNFIQSGSLIWTPSEPKVAFNSSTGVIGYADSEYDIVSNMW